MVIGLFSILWYFMKILILNIFVEILKNSKLYVNQVFFLSKGNFNDFFLYFSFQNLIEFNWKKIKNILQVVDDF